MLVLIAVCILVAVASAQQPGSIKRDKAATASRPQSAVSIIYWLFQVIAQQDGSATIILTHQQDSSTIEDTINSAVNHHLRPNLGTAYARHCTASHSIARNSTASHGIAQHSTALHG
jgi:hypothetical protein